MSDEYVEDTLDAVKRGCRSTKMVVGGLVAGVMLFWTWFILRKMIFTV